MNGVLRVEQAAYRGKHYQIPIFDTVDPVVIRAAEGRPLPISSILEQSDVVRCLGTTWDPSEFSRARQPLRLKQLHDFQLHSFTRPNAVRVLDMPIKMPDCDEYRLPRALEQFAETIQMIADYEHQLLPKCVRDEYHAYLTIDQRWVAPGTLHREAPCHVDGFQGARWHPRCLINHTYTVSDVLPTAYYVQPFDFTGLDEKVHDFFWEMNAQVADTNEAHRWQPDPGELTLMDCYSVHRGVVNESDVPVFRTWLRLSFEERRRVFDRVGNAHNPLFDYDWKMVDRDIEQLGLVPFRTDVDPSLNVFPWQAPDGSPLPTGAPKTQPRLRK